MSDQLTIAEQSTVCPCCLQPWEPEQLGDVAVCPECWPSQDRTEARMRDQLGRRLPWEETT